MLHLQVQASDVWDMSFLRDHLKKMKNIILALLDDDSPNTVSSITTAELTSHVECVDKSPVVTTNGKLQSHGLNGSTIGNGTALLTDASKDPTADELSDPMVSANKPEPPRSQITSTNEIPYPGYHFTPTTHHDTYPAISPCEADLSGKIGRAHV